MSIIFARVATSCGKRLVFLFFLVSLYLHDFMHTTLIKLTQKMQSHNDLKFVFENGGNYPSMHPSPE